VLFAALAPSPLAAQAPTASPAATGDQTSPLLTPAFAKSIQGKQIVVTTSDGRTRKGKFTVSPAGLTAERTQPPEVVPLGDIVKVKRVSHGLRNGTLIGFGVGFGLSLPILAGGCESDDCSVEGLIMMALGTGIGAGIGALFQTNKENVVYDAKRHAASTSVAPILTPARQGVAVLVSWR
jgi:hypothetical protein